MASVAACSWIRGVDHGLLGDGAVKVGVAFAV
jgi:hypothetical protein